ncbi:MAG TPA: ASCH domain-containing protein [bacterium]|nr:ASCH domain-containing protein [bacterium]
MHTYKALSLKQPFANWIAEGRKAIETRVWSTNYRGDLVICSSKSPKIEPAGYALCIVEVYDVKPMKKEDEKEACCKVYPKAQSWFLRNTRKIDPIIPVKGQLNIFNLELQEKLDFNWPKEPHPNLIS